MPRAVALIAVVAKSERVLEKVAHKHDGITPWEVDEAVVRTPVEASRWVHDDERGWRLKVAGRTAAGRRLLVVLYPVDEDDGVWRLGTAIRDD
ncbi:hypothetical protein [Iamia sp.]|uniref:hypothetical protein n=1 Tax=Iamia sp. TaxID=2722710 RepID=UPI002CC470BA|nr:hypothetical protein [Iamia sp.]HXH57006.1 hypothetical protein [Iamia sp.]